MATTLGAFAITSWKALEKLWTSSVQYAPSVVLISAINIPVPLYKKTWTDVDCDRSPRVAKGSVAGRRRRVTGIFARILVLPRFRVAEAAGHAENHRPHHAAEEVRQDPRDAAYRQAEQMLRQQRAIHLLVQVAIELRRRLRALPTWRVVRENHSTWLGKPCGSG